MLVVRRTVHITGDECKVSKKLHNKSTIHNFLREKEE